MRCRCIDLNTFIKNILLRRSDRSRLRSISIVLIKPSINYSQTMFVFIIYMVERVMISVCVGHSKTCRFNVWTKVINCRSNWVRVKNVFLLDLKKGTVWLPVWDLWIILIVGWGLLGPGTANDFCIRWWIEKCCDPISRVALLILLQRV